MVEVVKLNEGYFVSMTKQEALMTIQSLSEQMAKKSPNAGRVEMGTPYFTIAVKDDSNACDHNWTECGCKTEIINDIHVVKTCTKHEHIVIKRLGDE